MKGTRMLIAHVSRSLRDTFPGRASEWALATMLLNWSLILTLNPDLFMQGAGYRSLAELFAQPGWATLCAAVGSVRLLVLGINGAWRRSPHARAICAYLSCLVWFLISVGLVRSTTYGTGLAIYPVLLLLDSYNVIRATGEAGLSDASHRRAGANGTHL